jgi:hypothetical protein
MTTMPACRSWFHRRQFPSKAKENPLDVAGCWSGEIEDNGSRTGSGFLFFVPKGKKAVKGTDTGGMIGTASFLAPVEGKVRSRHFSQSEGKRMSPFHHRTNAQ